MLILHNGVLLLAALNLAVNAALGVTILLRYPWPIWPVRTLRLDSGYEKPELKTTTKGETPMNRAWTEVLVTFLVAATEMILELVKKIKKKGETA